MEHNPSMFDEDVPIRKRFFHTYIELAEGILGRPQWCKSKDAPHKAGILWGEAKHS